MLATAAATCDSRLHPNPRHLCRLLLAAAWQSYDATRHPNFNAGWTGFHSKEVGELSRGRAQWPRRLSLAPYYFCSPDALSDWIQRALPVYCSEFMANSNSLLNVGIYSLAEATKLTGVSAGW